jgi:transcriptional regulator with XRE-family HTH domain
MFGSRLRQLRLSRGLTLDALVAQIGGVVTKQALSKYERGKARPSAVVLNKLAEALGVKASYLWSDPAIVVEFVAYRRGSTLPKREQARVESMVAEGLEARVRLQELLGYTDGAELPVQTLKVDCVEEAEQATMTLRDLWKLGLDPIANVVDVLEHHFVHVIEIETNEKFDGISSVAYDQEHRMRAAAVVTRKGIPGERQRLNLAHELGHLMLQVPEGGDQERMAFRFGAAFLAPAPVIEQEVGRRRAFIELEELLLLKRRFGMSVQALLFRLRDLGIISESYYRQWCIDINRLGWRKHEPLEMPPEQPQWIRRGALRALAEGLVSREEAETMIGERISTAVPLPVVERRAFMKLPLEERRRLLAEQAAKLADHYAQDAEWRELEAGDLVEY